MGLKDKSEEVIPLDSGITLVRVKKVPSLCSLIPSQCDE